MRPTRCWTQDRDARAMPHADTIRIMELMDCDS